MTRHQFKIAGTGATLALALLVAAGSPAAAQPSTEAAPPARREGATAARVPPPQIVLATSADARQTRKDFKAVLDKYPPSVGRVLKLDPTLLSNETYLAAYPLIAAFVAGHPEVARNPRYFFGDVYLGDEYVPPDARTRVLDMWNKIVEGSAVLIVFFVITSAIVWLIKSLIDYRRWRVQSKIQAEMQNKLLDRLTRNEEVLAYVQSPAGRRLLDAAPPVLDLSARDVGVPLRRVLWAAQAGLVLAAFGLGLMFVSYRVIAEMQQQVFALGAVIVFVGVGFLLSAGVSYGMTRHLGLFEGLQAGRRGTAGPEA